MPIFRGLTRETGAVHRFRIPLLCLRGLIYIYVLIQPLDVTLKNWFFQFLVAVRLIDHKLKYTCTFTLDSKLNSTGIKTLIWFDSVSKKRPGASETIQLMRAVWQVCVKLPGEAPTRKHTTVKFTETGTSKTGICAFKIKCGISTPRLTK